MTRSDSWRVLEYRLLGPLEVRAGDGPLPLGGVKQRALLALLLLNANRVVARERLIDTLWSEAPETAVKLVQLYVSKLRKLLPAGAIATRAPATCWRSIRIRSICCASNASSRRHARRSPRGRPGCCGRRSSSGVGPALGEPAEEPFFRTESARSKPRPASC
jgi:hypothetical protein